LTANLLRLFLFIASEPRFPEARYQAPACVIPSKFDILQVLTWKHCWTNWFDASRGGKGDE
jgi:hypothetical protein